jgi:hypothetical protein
MQNGAPFSYRTLPVKRLTTAIVMTLCLSLPAMAEVYDPFVSQLRDQGYGQITVGRTWLGRIVISATREDVAREIVLNARTGEILGDQASIIGAPVKPRYTNLESSDDSDDSDNDTAAATATPPVDAITASDVGDTRAILDTGTPVTVDD